jgi:hypothetical protein
MTNRLFHFSEDGRIDLFVPRPVQAPSQRRPGYEWLNGPLVWAIDQWHQPMYLFPRDCPRILLWPTSHSTDEDIARYFAGSAARIVAYTEQNWLARIAQTTLYRYELPSQTFESLNDAGMWVSRATVKPIQRDKLRHLPEALQQAGVELRAIENLLPLKSAWDSSLHVSGIRLRNALGWSS